MARSRNIKPGFFKNEDLLDLNPLARILFAGLWTIADRSGRLEDRPKKIKIELLPGDNCDVDEFLVQLAEKGLIIRYESGTDRFIAIPKWEKHQNPHINEVPSTIPEPDENSSRTIPEPDENRTSPADSLLLIPDSFNLSCPEASREGSVVHAKPSAKSVHDPTIATWFEAEFWPAYPRKDDRKNALRAVQKQAKSETRRAEIMSGLNAQLPELSGRQRTFIPLASTWLNGERWNDLPAAADISTLRGKGAGRQAEIDAEWEARAQ